MQPPTTESKSDTSTALAAPAAVPPPPTAPAPSSVTLPTEARGARITVEQLLAMPDSAKRNAWFSALMEVEIARQTFALDQAHARNFALSGAFSDIKGSTLDQAIAMAMVKISMGRSWALNEADSIKEIYFVNGRPAVQNAIVAAKLKQAGYDWDIEWIDDFVDHKGRKYPKCVGCTLWLKRLNRMTNTWEVLKDRNTNPVSVSFTQYDADTAEMYQGSQKKPLSEKDNYKSFPRDMYFWKCISRVSKYYAPEVMRGAPTRDEVEMLTAPETVTLPPPEIEQPVPGLATSVELAKDSLREKILAHPGWKPEAQITADQISGEISFFPLAESETPPTEEPKPPRKRTPASASDETPKKE